MVSATQDRFCIVLHINFGASSYYWCKYYIATVLCLEFKGAVKSPDFQLVHGLLSVIRHMSALGSVR